MRYSFAWLALAMGCVPEASDSVPAVDRELDAGTVQLADGGVVIDGGVVTPRSFDAALLDAAVSEPPPSKVFEPGDPGVVDVMLEVQLDRDQRAISPLIYGANRNERPLWRERYSLLRLGGNRLTAYNWENNASNAGADYHYQNDGYLEASDEPAKAALSIVDTASTLGWPAILTIQIGDHVAADKLADGDVRMSGPSYLTTRFKRNEAVKPTPFARTPNGDDDVVYQDEFVSFLKQKRPDATVLFSMDNEPELWRENHAALFDAPLTYAELWRRNHDYAKAIKQVWPSAQVLGAVSYGYQGFLSLQNAPDANGRNFIEWYLQQASASEKLEGTRLIDYLDVHWYPEAVGGGERVTSASTEPDVVAARLQAPRSLWDPSYEEESWIHDELGGPIDLLYWLRAKIDAHYPGTKLAITEWNYGAGQHISGALATADALGIFGRHGVDLATHWTLLPDEPYAYAAFDAFRNYDERGGRFGDTAVYADSTDLDTATVYASTDTRDPERTVLIALNKSSTATTAGIKIARAPSYRTASVYVVTARQPAVVPAPSLAAVAPNAFRYEMPPHSLSVIVPRP